jgi:hypothetical protein
MAARLQADAKDFLRRTISCRSRLLSEFQDVAPLATYHGEIGREATAQEHEPAADV